MISELQKTEDAKTPEEMRESILKLESCMLEMKEHQIEIKTTHYFSPGLYMREIFVPKGTALTGKIQKTEYMNIISQGAISVMTEAGLKLLKGPSVLRSHPGLKRAGYAHEDTTWLTIHQNPTNERDIDKLEESLFADSFDEVPEIMNRNDEAPVITSQGKPKNILRAKYFASPRQYADVLAALETTEEQVLLESNNSDDRISVETLGVCVKDSLIQGKGLFSTRKYCAGEVIAPARIGNRRAQAGRYSNHSPTPNSKMVMRENGDVDLVAIKDIAPDTEITSDYYLNVIETRRD